MTVHSPSLGELLVKLSLRMQRLLLFIRQASISIRLVEQELKGKSDTTKDFGWSAVKFQEIVTKLPGAASSFVPSLGTN